MNELPEYLRGAVHIHVHSTPDLTPRRYDDIDFARQAAAAGYSALLLKNNIVPTMGRAYLTQKSVPGITVHGGIVLNESVGGFNIAAVRAALELGARTIWMPTVSAHNYKMHHGEHGGLTVFDAHGELRHHVKDIVIEMAHAKAILATGHLHPEEGAALLRYAYAQGLRRLLVNHPDSGSTRYPLELQKDLASYGVMFDRHLSAPPGLIAQAVQEVGAASTILTPDLEDPASAAGLAAGLRGAGCAEADLRRMLVTNPQHLLE